MHKLEPKVHLTLPYKNYAKQKKKEIAQIQAKNTPNTTLLKLCKENNMQKFEPKKSHNTTLHKLF